jgi:hypothetical protein
MRVKVSLLSSRKREQIGKKRELVRAGQGSLQQAIKLCEYVSNDPERREDSAVSAGQKRCRTDLATSGFYQS